MATLGEEERGGELWLLADCRSPGAAESLFDALWGRGWRTLGRRSPHSLWLERAEEPDGPAPLDFDGLDDVVGCGSAQARLPGPLSRQ